MKGINDAFNNRQTYTPSLLIYDDCAPIELLEQFLTFLNQDWLAFVVDL